MKLLTRLFLVLLLFSLAACGPPLSAVYVSTRPVGGMVKVKETGTIVPDGGKIHLPQGKYHLDPYQVPNSPGSVVITVNGFDEERVVVPTGPEELLSRFTIHTVPAGGTVTVVETNRSVADGGTLTLPGGRFTLRPSLAGYTPRDVTLDVKENTEEEILIHLGTGYANLSLATEPAGAEVAIDGEPRGQAPLSMDLPEGVHQLALSKSGYFPQQQEVRIAAARDQDLKLTLKPVPTRGTAQVHTDPPGGSVFFQGRKLGKGSVDLGRLPFGRYRVKGVKQLDARNRLVGEVSFRLKRDKTYRVTIPLDQQQRRYHDKWLPRAEALRLEQQNYSGQRVANPVAIDMTLDDAALATFGGPDQLVQALNAILRVGDRVTVKRGGTRWLLWKRDARPDPEFKDMATALFAGATGTLPWAADPAAVTVRLSAGDSSPAGLAFALHRARTPLPLLDLADEQLAAGGETISRSQADGVLTLVVEAKTAPQMDGSSVKAAEGLWLAQIPAGSEPLRLAWKEKPRRLLLVSDTPAPFDARVPETSLLINEKKIVNVAGRARVEKLVRLSDGPDYEHWQRQEFTVSGPLAAQLDLSRDEVGPNGRFGDYRRIWLVNYRNGEALSQRQVMASYRVVDQKKDFSSEKFLRRGKLGSQ
ncbi:PEGA domain-containing protein [Geothermobacter hydrogeniphilus]|nr:PEGA domain-containing protein [Geothermobacter hydrogeniphilus]